MAGKSLDDLAKEPAVIAMFQEHVDSLNSQLERWETIKKFTILDRDLSEEGGELTASLKVKRKVVLLQPRRGGLSPAAQAFETFAADHPGRLDPAAPADFELLQYAERLIASSIGAASSRLVMSLLLRKRTVSAKAALKLLDDSHAALHFNREILQTALNHVRQGIAVLSLDKRGAGASGALVADRLHRRRHYRGVARLLGEGVGALRLRLVAVKDGAAAFAHRGADGKYAPEVLLDLDYWALVPV